MIEETKGEIPDDMNFLEIWSKEFTKEKNPALSNALCENVITAF